MVEVVKVMKWFTILTSFCYVCGEKIVSLALNILVENF
jgi:hypothetical protein